MDLPGSAFCAVWREQLTQRRYVDAAAAHHVLLSVASERLEEYTGLPSVFEIQRLASLLQIPDPSMLWLPCSPLPFLFWNLPVLPIFGSL